MSICTEEEAKTKWCPQSRYAFPIGTVSGNRDVTLEGHSGFESSAKCIGSACMLWRWHKTNTKFCDLSPEDRALSPTSENDTDLVPAHKTYGFCGLAGRP